MTHFGLTLIILGSMVFSGAMFARELRSWEVRGTGDGSWLAASAWWEDE